MEKETCKEIFDNEMDVVADSIIEMADRIVEKVAYTRPIAIDCNETSCALDFHITICQMLRRQY